MKSLWFLECWKIEDYFGGLDQFKKKLLIRRFCTSGERNGHNLQLRHLSDDSCRALAELTSLNNIRAVLRTRRVHSADSDF